MTLAKRIERARRWQERYRTDPHYRLAALNRTRRAAGRPTLEALEHSTKLHRRVGPPTDSTGAPQEDRVT